MKYVSLFAGIGGFDLALDRQGHECVYVNEWDSFAAKTYEKNFKRKPDTRDIRTVDASEIPDHQILVGGFPCQSFSVAGKRKGFEDTRGTLFFEICRILRAKRPTYLLLENVKGLLSHDAGQTFFVIIRSLDELGYDCEWQVLNSKYFGVPQNRERVFIVGHLRGKPRTQVFPIRQGESNVISRDQKGANRVADTITARYGARTSRGTHISRFPLKFLSRNQKEIEGDYAYTVDGKNTGGIMVVNKPTHSNNRVYNDQGISPALNTMQGGRRQPKILAHYGHKNKPATEMNVSPTLKAQSHGHQPMVNDDLQIRRLTPLECERLQGFPDKWTAGVSDTQRYKQLGNAVTVNVVEYIVKKLA